MRYDTSVKCDLLQVDRTLIEEHTCESQRVTDELAKNLRSVIQATIHAAITGLADESGSETKDKPMGTIFISVYYKYKMHRRKKLFRGSPLAIQTKACEELYKFILEIVQ